MLSEAKRKPLPPGRKRSLFWHDTFVSGSRVELHGIPNEILIAGYHAVIKILIESGTGSRYSFI